MLNQNYSKIEHIINDSYSTDNTTVIIDNYIKKVGDRYKVIYIQTKPQGIAKAINDCLEIATGDIIHFLHSDVYYLNQHVLQTVANYFIEDNKVDWLVGNRVYLIKNQVITIPETLIAMINPKLYIKLGGPIHHENTFVKTKLVKEAGGADVKRKLAVEIRLWLRLSKKYVPKFVNKNFAVAIWHPKSASNKSLSAFLQGTLEAIQVIKKQKSLDRHNR